MSKHWWKKLLILLGLAAILCACHSSTVSQTSEETKKDQKVQPVLNDEKAKEVAMNFVLHVYSDFADHSQNIDNFVSKDNEALREWMKDRQEILALHLQLRKRDIKPLSSEVKEIGETKLNDHMCEVLMTVHHKYLTQGSEAFMSVIYKVVVDKEQEYPVVAAMSSDISASKLLGGEPLGYEELKVEYQLNPTKVQKPYNLEERKQALQELEKEFK